MSTKYNFRVSINGTKRGLIWWPRMDAEKSFSYTPKEDETLRDAILRITNDGDFESCDVLLDTFVEVTMIKATATSTLKRTRFFEINSPLFTSIQDCITEDYPNFEEA